MEISLIEEAMMSVAEVDSTSSPRPEIVISGIFKSVLGGRFSRLNPRLLF